MKNYNNRWVKQKIRHHWKENQKTEIRFKDIAQNLAQRDKEMQTTKQNN